MYLNTVFRGEAFCFLDPTDDILLGTSDLKELGISITGSEEVIGDKSYLSLSSLKPQISFELDLEKLVLLLTVDPRILASTSIDLNRRPPGELEYLAHNSAFFNYGIDYSAYNENWSANLPFEFGLYGHGLFLFSNFNYLHGQDDDNFNRLMTQLTYDDRSSLRRITLGDFNSAASGQLGSRVLLGGISISREFSLDPYYISYPTMNLSGVIQTPSDVELWKDGMLLRREKLSPGEFDFLNIPGTSGTNEVELVIRDAFGLEKRVIVPFYFTSDVLKAGVHSYHYDLGQRRRKFGTENFEYDTLTAVFDHRYGLSDNLTVGGRGEFTEDLSNIGFRANLLMKRLGHFNCELAMSQNGEEGTAYSLGYAFTHRNLGFGLMMNLRGFSRNYSNLSLPEETDRERQVRGITGTFNLGQLGALSLSYTSTGRYLAEDQQHVVLRFSRNFSQNLALDLSFTHKEDTESTNEAFAMLRYSFSDRTSVNLSHRLSDDENRTSLQAQRSAVGDRGYRFRLQADQNAAHEKKENKIETEISYGGKYGLYSGRYNWNDDHKESYNLRLSGGVGLIHGGFHLGQPIRDSFSVVKVGKLAGVEVAANNVSYGATNDRGEVLVNRTNSNRSNEISINSADVPIDYTVEKAERYISPPYRSGTYVEFPLLKNQSITGKLALIENGKETFAEFWWLTLYHNGATYESPVGRGGEYYFDNLFPGKYNAIIAKGEKQCSFELIIPESSELFTDLGLTRCSMD